MREGLLQLRHQRRSGIDIGAIKLHQHGMGLQLLHLLGYRVQALGNVGLGAAQQSLHPDQRQCALRRGRLHQQQWHRGGAVGRVVGMRRYLCQRGRHGAQGGALAGICRRRPCLAGPGRQQVGQRGALGRGACAVGGERILVHGISTKSRAGASRHRAHPRHRAPTRGQHWAVPAGHQAAGPPGWCPQAAAAPGVA